MDPKAITGLNKRLFPQFGRSRDQNLKLDCSLMYQANMVYSRACLLNDMITYSGYFFLLLAPFRQT